LFEVMEARKTRAHLNEQGSNAMSGGGEYEPRDSRRVVGTKDKKRSWREEEEHARKGRGEYEPHDSRNVTGTATTPDGRWTNKSARPPRADGRSPDAGNDRD
jgi:hypothetical protein